MEMMLLASPIIAVLASVVVAIYKAKYWLLLGIPISLFGMTMTTPGIMRGGQGVGGLFLLIVFGLFVWACIERNFVGAFLLGSCWIPNFLLTVAREQNRQVMTETVLTSEPIFLYYYFREDIHVERKR